MSIQANKGRICYACKRKGHLSYECPNGMVPKPNTFDYNDMLRKTTNGVSTSKVMCSPQTSAKAIWVSKHLLTNPKGSNKSWVPKSLYAKYFEKRSDTHGIWIKTVFTPYLDQGHTCLWIKK